MSVYFDGTGDTVRIVDGSITLTVGTGAVNIAAWVLVPSSLPGARRDVFWVASATNMPSGQYFGGIFNNATNSFRAFVSGGSESSTDDYAISADTWYWMVVSRDGAGTARVRLFADSTSTTPLQNSTVSDSSNQTAFDTFMLGQSAITDPTLVMKMTNFKIYTGAEWTNAECRTEALYYGIQKSGGTDRLCWRLKDIDADTDGLNEFGGAGPNFTNSGAVTDAAMPTNLSEAGGGGSIGFDDGDGPVFLTRLRPATTVRLV